MLKIFHLFFLNAVAACLLDCNLLMDNSLEIMVQIACSSVKF